MRRGRIVRDPAALPDALLDARVAATQAAMARASVDALVVYTNHTRANAVWRLCGFVPYWSESALVLTRSGGPVLVTALSKRVHDWIERTARLRGVVSAPRLGAGIGQVIGEENPRAAVALAEMATLPDGLVATLRAELPDALLVDAAGELLPERDDAAEAALVERAAAIAREALEAAAGEATTYAAIAAAEHAARRAGAEEVLIAIAPDLDRDRRFLRLDGVEPEQGTTWALRATVAYEGAWTRVVRTFSGDPARRAAIPGAEQRLRDAVQGLPATHGFAGAPWWLVESSRGTQPLEPLLGSGFAGEAPPAGALVTAQALIDGVAVGGPLRAGS